MLKFCIVLLIIPCGYDCRVHRLISRQDWDLAELIYNRCGLSTYLTMHEYGVLLYCIHSQSGWLVMDFFRSIHRRVWDSELNYTPVFQQKEWSRHDFQSCRVHAEFMSYSISAGKGSHEWLRRKMQLEREMFHSKVWPHPCITSNPVQL